jgi:alpha/beta superfamily hydrolase
VTITPTDYISFKSNRPSGTIELEGALHLPQTGSVAPAVVLCHPHPSGGGEMGVHLIVNIADKLARMGAVALRFNFGGVGTSEGSFTGGFEEPIDIAAACDYVRSLEYVDPNGVDLCGWSFGAWMSLMALAEGVEAKKCAAIAPPLSMVDWREEASRVAGSRAQRRYFVGGRDQFCSVVDLREFAAAVSEQDADSVEVLEDVDHFLFGHEKDVVKLVTDFLRQQV